MVKVEEKEQRMGDNFQDKKLSELYNTKGEENTCIFLRRRKKNIIDQIANCVGGTKCYLVFYDI